MQSPIIRTVNVLRRSFLRRAQPCDLLRVPGVVVRRLEDERKIRDGATFDAVICGCDVQQTFCWQPDMCITDACEAEYRPLLDAEIRILAAAPGERFSIIEICTDRLFLGDAFSQCAAGYCSPREYRRLFRAG